MANNGAIFCPWCVETEFACKGVASCEFKTLKKNKRAIYGRMKKIVGELEVLRAELQKPGLKEEELRKKAGQVLDKAFGLEKMIVCLGREFNVSRGEALRIAGFRKLSALEKIKLVRRFRGA